MTSMVSQRCLRAHPADRYSSRVPTPNKTRRRRPRLSAAKSQPGGPLAAAISAGLNLHRMLTRGRPPAVYGPPRSGPTRCGRLTPRRGTRAPPSRRPTGPARSAGTCAGRAGSSALRAGARGRPRTGPSARMRRCSPYADDARGPGLRACPCAGPARRRLPVVLAIAAARPGVYDSLQYRDGVTPKWGSGGTVRRGTPIITCRRSTGASSRPRSGIISGEPSRRSMSATSTARGHLTAADARTGRGSWRGVTLRAPVATAA